METVMATAMEMVRKTAIPGANLLASKNRPAVLAAGLSVSESEHKSKGKLRWLRPVTS
jgi:formate dehydrogenase assembly factor FdhD